MKHVDETTHATSPLSVHSMHFLVLTHENNVTLHSACE